MTSFVSNLYLHFENVTDPRVNRCKKYPLLEMVFVALCGTICGCNNWVEIEIFGNSKLTWFRKFFPFEHGIPSHDTFSRVFARLDSVEFYAALESWTMTIVQTLKGHTVAMDGKQLRGSHDRASGKSALHSVSAWVCGLKMCIGLKSVDAKSNEIPAVQSLIDMLDLQGAIVTTDAMHCQRETAQKLIDKQADYIFMVKRNQKLLQQEVVDTITQAFEEGNAHMKNLNLSEKNRNREETREVSIMPVPKDNAIFSRWAGVQTIGIIYRSCMLDGKLQESSDYFMTSMPCKVRRVSQHLRQHWSIENQQHYILDVTFTEDASRIRKGTGPEISSAFRRLALNILQRDTSAKGSINSKRKRCGWNEHALESIIANFQPN